MRVPDLDFKIRPIKGAAEFSQFSELLDLSFEVAPGTRFFDDFPVWEQGRDSRAMHCLGVFSATEGLVAGAAARLAYLDHPRETGKTILIGIIGAVATHPTWRGRGLASNLVRRLTAWIASQKATLAVLWGSDHQFYRRLGFALCGRQAILPLSQLSLPSPLNEVGRGWRPSIFERIRQRTGGLKLGESDRIWIEAHKNIRWFWAGPEDQPAAYAALGRGIDLAGLVHEWGGEPQALQRLLARIAQEHPETGVLGEPDQVLGLPLRQGVRLETQALCMARVLDPRPWLSPGADAFLNVASNGEQGAQLAEKFFGEGSDPNPLFRIWFWGLDSA